MSKTKSSPSSRTAKGTFRKGTSGNPSGRPRGETARLREKLAEGADAVVRAVLKAAKDGDMQAAKLVLDRLMPPLRPKAEPVTVDLPANPSPLTIANAIIAAAASGDIPPDVAAQLVSSISALTKIEETEELRERITALERATQATNPKNK